MKRLIIILLLIFSNCTIFNNEVMTAFNSITIPVAWSNPTVYSLNTRKYKYGNINVASLDQYLGKFEKIRLLTFTIHCSQIEYLGTPVNEYNRRNTSQWEFGIVAYKLAGGEIRDPLSGSLVRPKFDQNRMTYDFGKGIIVDTIIFPSLVEDILISSDPPTGATANLLSGHIIIEYNHNFGLFN